MVYCIVFYLFAISIYIFRILVENLCIFCKLSSYFGSQVYGITKL